VIFKIDDESGGVAGASNQDEVSVKIKGTLYGFLFEEKNLTKKIVETIIPKYDGSEVYIPNIKDFTISLSTGSTIFSFSDIKNINFNFYIFIINLSRKFFLFQIFIVLLLRIYFPTALKSD